MFSKDKSEESKFNDNGFSEIHRERNWRRYFTVHYVFHRTLRVRDGYARCTLVHNTTPGVIFRAGFYSQQTHFYMGLYFGGVSISGGGGAFILLKQIKKKITFSKKFFTTRKKEKSKKQQNI